jgi:diphthamide biosynthesis methyltransferase
MDQLELKQKDINFLTRKKSLETNTRARQDESKNHDCSFTVAEKALLAKVHLQMADALKKKGKAERAGIVQAIGTEHQNLMIPWFMCRMNGQIT